MTDRQLPQSLEAEQAVIGTCLMNPNSILEIASILLPEMFYVESNRQLYQAIWDVAKKNGSSDIISVCDYLNKKGQLDNFGGIVGLTKRTEKIVTDQYLEKYCYIIKEKHCLREYIRIGHELSNMAFVEDLADIIEKAETELFNISNFTQGRDIRRIDKCVDEVLSEVTAVYNKEKTLIGVPSGFTDIDRLTGGWQPGDLIIIAARPSMGKTALALSMAKNASELGYGVGIFSLEMSAGALTTRLLSSVSGYTNMEIRNAKINLDKLGIDSNNVAVLPLWIDDTSAITLFELRSKTKRAIIKFGIKIIFVDYLQLMRAEAGNREQEISKISQGLKAIAKEFNIPVIALAQLNREVEKRSDKKPKLSDLRESGAIEQDADIVCFIHRPGYYDILECTINGDNYDSKGLISFDCAKDRNGALFSTPLFHNESFTIIKQKRDEITESSHMGKDGLPF